jgi:hypothetical protein
MSLGLWSAMDVWEDVEVMRIAVEEVVGPDIHGGQQAMPFGFPAFIYVVWFICYCCSSVVI